MLKAQVKKFRLEVRQRNLSYREVGQSFQAVFPGIDQEDSLEGLSYG
jgi:hypothetical protein